MPWDWHPHLEHARKLGITILQFCLRQYGGGLPGKPNTPAYKIASFEAVDLPLIKYAAGTGRNP